MTRTNKVLTSNGRGRGGPWLTTCGEPSRHAGLGADHEAFGVVAVVESALIGRVTTLEKPHDEHRPLSIAFCALYLYCDGCNQLSAAALLRSGGQYSKPAASYRWDPIGRY